ncbi:MAG: hypothetical protein K8E24_013650, partial [Methanobacterium paludis]|nr:hypothetical protein [Methanobacterium paludis]
SLGYTWNYRTSNPGIIGLLQEGSDEYDQKIKKINDSIFSTFFIFNKYYTLIIHFKIVNV